jgi:thiosulfate/3-mercaptopyruvate sulfurtransferase
MDSLVTTDWLAGHLDDPDLVVLDCSVYLDPEEGGSSNVSGRARYDEGHIPGAGFADLMGDLADADAPIQFAVPTPEAFCAAMGRLGVGDDSSVVLYDGSMTAWAARVWWMLRWIGFDRAAILDGGLGAWTQEGRPLTAEPAPHPVRSLTPNPRPELIADRDEVLAAIGDVGTRIIDTLMAEHYRGDMAMYARPGHITGAENQSVMDLFDETGRFKPNEDLAGVLAGDPSMRAITYCGGGIAASANAFAMTRLGFTDVAVYTASLQEWTADPHNPMTVGDG